jgi:hypothetical protein
MYFILGLGSCCESFNEGGLKHVFFGFVAACCAVEHHSAFFNSEKWTNILCRLAVSFFVKLSMFSTLVTVCEEKRTNVSRLSRLIGSLIVLALTMCTRHRYRRISYAGNFLHLFGTAIIFIAVYWKISNYL